MCSHLLHKFPFSWSWFSVEKAKEPHCIDKHDENKDNKPVRIVLTEALQGPITILGRFFRATVSLHLEVSALVHLIHPCIISIIGLWVDLLVIMLASSRQEAFLPWWLGHGILNSSRVVLRKTLMKCGNASVSFGIGSQHQLGSMFLLYHPPRKFQTSCLMAAAILRV